ncbi:hypothetical protein PMG11_08980 [Penicillium brasilianum]|uniref:CID domain-containing protein n=1 Tax=Penicillium brasilianum TaxID=104259 RepID=A0A0F7TUQ3_PENBI|nr:hypothetical protein PMG11_08980 [Penicillium brasilianum]
MASHQIAIAKASFSAGLLRPDPSSVPRDDIAAFHTALERALNHCSPANIQTCKTWLLQYVASSANRVGGLAKYLVALAGSSDEPATAAAGPGGRAGAGTRSKTSVKRRRLHILYLLNDLFHHSKYHLDTTGTFSTVSGSLQPYVVELLGHAAAYDRQKNPRHHRRLDELLDIWSEHGYFGPELVQKLRETAKNSAFMGITGTAPSSSTDVLIEETDAAKKLAGKEVPFIMPSTHGDPSTPYYDLPAGNWIPHIIPNSSIPLHADSIKPLHFLAGPADQSLVKALKDFLQEADLIYGAEELIKDDENMDIDELGQRVTRDEITGDILDGETYYGWSRAFCQQMKKRPDDSRSRSRSHSRSRGALKRRYSDSSLSQDSQRSDSQSRSRARTSKRENRRYNSRSRSRSPRRSRSRTSESSYAPREPSPPRFPPPHQPSHAPPPPPPPPGPYHQPQPYNPQYPAAPSGANFAPPPPPPYPGAWPPGPPPHMPGMPFPPLGQGMNPAFAPTFPGMPMIPGQQLPPGQYHFPPPHPGGQHGDGWGQQGGRGWR